MEISLLLLVTVLGFFLINTLQQFAFWNFAWIGRFTSGITHGGPAEFISINNFGDFCFSGDCRALDWFIGDDVNTACRNCLYFRNYLHKISNKFKNSESSSELLGRKHFGVRRSLWIVLFLIQFYFRIDTIMLGVLASEREVWLVFSSFQFDGRDLFHSNDCDGCNLSRTVSSQTFSPHTFEREYCCLRFPELQGGVPSFYWQSGSFICFLHQNFNIPLNILQILAFAIPLVFWGYLMTQSLVALDHNRIYLGITAGGVLLNVLLNFWLIPEHGASGAAVATVITEALIPFSCFLMILKHQLSSPPAHGG